MRTRKRLITNLYVNDKDIKRLANGYVVYKSANKHPHCIIPKHKIAQDKKNELIAKQEAKVQREQERLAKLKGVSDNKLIRVTLPSGRTYTKRGKYTKKNQAYWDNLKNPAVMQARVKRGKLCTSTSSQSSPTA